MRVKRNLLKRGIDLSVLRQAAGYAGLTCGFALLLVRRRVDAYVCPNRDGLDTAERYLSAPMTRGPLFDALDTGLDALVAAER